MSNEYRIDNYMTPVRNIRGLTGEFTQRYGVAWAGRVDNNGWVIQGFLCAADAQTWIDEQNAW